MVSIYRAFGVPPNLERHLGTPARVDLLGFAISRILQPRRWRSRFIDRECSGVDLRARVHLERPPGGRPRRPRRSIPSSRRTGSRATSSIVGCVRHVPISAILREVKSNYADQRTSRLIEPNNWKISRARNLKNSIDYPSNRYDTRYILFMSVLAICVGRDTPYVREIFNTSS